MALDRLLLKASTGDIACTQWPFILDTLKVLPVLQSDHLYTYFSDVSQHFYYGDHREVRRTFVYKPEVASQLGHIITAIGPGVGYMNPDTVDHGAFCVSIDWRPHEAGYQQQEEKRMVEMLVEQIKEARRAAKAVALPVDVFAFDNGKEKTTELGEVLRRRPTMDRQSLEKGWGWD